MIVVLLVASPEVLFAFVDNSANNVSFEASNAATSSVTLVHVAILHFIDWLSIARYGPIIFLNVSNVVVPVNRHR